jgi:hypothetical protein
MQEFKLQHPIGLTICRTLSPSDVENIDSVKKRDIGNGYCWFDFPISEIEGSKVAISLCFNERTLEMLILALANPDLYGGSWDDWSEAKERLCAKDTESWLRSKGFHTGTFPWGVIWAGYDSKGGSGSAAIRYNAEQGAAANP